MSRIAVLGVGNPLMRDDGIGVRVAEMIRDRLEAKNIKVILGETDVSYCLDCICADDFLVLLDAIHAGGLPGSVWLLPMEQAVSCRQKPYAAHDMSLVDAIAEEYPKSRGVLIGIEPEDVGIGLELSACLQDQFSRICADVEALLQKIMEDEADA